MEKNVICKYSKMSMLTTRTSLVVELIVQLSAAPSEKMAYLKLYFLNYNKPRVVTSNRRTYFTSKELEDFLNEFDIVHQSSPLLAGVAS